MCVLHRCDTPACVNPDHLFLGTRADKAREMHSQGVSLSGIGRRFGVDPKTISAAVQRKTWKHVD